MKVVWLAPYPISNLTNVVFSRDNVKHGTGTWLQNLALELANHQEIELHIVCEAGNVPYHQSFFEGNIRFHIIRNTFPFMKRGYPHYFPIQELSNYRLNSHRINKVLKTINPDIIHAQGTENSYSTTAIRSGFPHVISIQGILNEFIKKNPNPAFRDKLKARLELRSIKAGKHYICRTDFDQSFIRSNNTRAIIHLVCEAMNPVYFSTNWECAGDNSLLFVGSLEERKGILILLSALIQLKKQFANVRLYVIGNGTSKYLKRLKSFCADNDISDNVSFLGYQPPEKIADYHIKSQLFICPSFAENSPNTVAEAMITGLPIVASKVGGIPSMISDTETGYLFEPGDTTELCEKISFLLSKPEIREKISSNARIIGRERHSPEHVAVNTINVYRAVLKNNH